MAWALVSHRGDDLGISGGTTGTIDTSGANFLVAVVSIWDVSAPNAFSDSKSNTWTGLTAKQELNNLRNRIYYAKNATVGSGHTFTQTGTSVYASVCVAAFSNGDTTAPFDVENGATQTAAVTSIATGSITPGSDNELIIAGWGNADAAVSALSIDNGMTIADSVAYRAGNTFSSGLAYKIQTTAAAINPTWSWTTAEACCATIASFKAAAAGATSLPKISIFGRQAVNRAGTY